MAERAFLRGRSCWCSVLAGTDVVGHSRGAGGTHLCTPPASPRWKGQLVLGKLYISVMSALNLLRVSQVDSTCCVRLFCALTTACSAHPFKCAP